MHELHEEMPEIHVEEGVQSFMEKGLRVVFNLTNRILK